MREIQALRRLSPHAHIILLEEVLYDQPTGRLALVFELMDVNLYEMIRGRRQHLSGLLVRSYMRQLLAALDHMHKKGIFHRDIKPENILIDSSSSAGRELKLADFGSCRGIYSKQPYTEYISTRWYRAPECLLTDGFYGPEMDVWGAGCVFFEITSLYPLFPGTNELDQIDKIHKVLGTPDQNLLRKFKQKGAAHIIFDFTPQGGIGIGHLINHASERCVELMTRMLAHDPQERISAREALLHLYFAKEREQFRSREKVHLMAKESFVEVRELKFTSPGLPILSLNNTLTSCNTFASLKPKQNVPRASLKTLSKPNVAIPRAEHSGNGTLPPLRGVARSSQPARLNDNRLSRKKKCQFAGGHQSSNASTGNNNCRSSVWKLSEK